MLDKKDIGTILSLLERAQIQGAEAPALMRVVDILQKMGKELEEESAPEAEDSLED